MKSSLKIASISILAAALISPAVQAEITANVALQSDYIWRGVSQNAKDPSVQGGFDYGHESGLYAGVWGASVDFGAAESTELDLYLGYATEFKNGVGIDVGLIEYTYHGSNSASDSNFTEAYAGISYAGFGVTYYAGDEFDDNIELSYGYDFEATGLSIAATYGDYDSYNYYQVGLSGGFGDDSKLGWDVSYWDTDTDNTANSDGRAVFTISATF